jgi:BirA family biotin operon repressor/biotin-[acetyl-CoA-carboxylase] ligase
VERRHFASLPSTQDAAREWAREGAPHLAVVSAEQQTAGRGRLGRAWSSPPGESLSLSLVLRTRGGIADGPKLTMLLSLAACRAVDELAGLRAGVKWPNDVLLNGRKIGGVLCETEGDACILGLGLNLNMEASALPERPVFPASSLRIETGTTYEFDKALGAVSRHIGDLDARFVRGDWERLRSEWEARCMGLGGPVVVREASGEWRGIALMTDASGALLVGTPEGMRRVVAGDVSWND